MRARSLRGQDMVSTGVQQVAAKAAVERADEQRESAAPTAAPTWPAGISDTTEAPASGSEFLGRNSWTGPVAGRPTTVYAGDGGVDHPTTGRLLVLTQGATSADDSTGRWVDLEGSGALTVVSARGSTLTLTDAHGAAHRFDVATLTWLG